MGRQTWAGVVRVSSVGGRAPDRFHADKEQADDIKRAVEAIGGRLDLLPAELDVSGGLALEKRPSLIRAIEGVEDGTYAGIVVSYLSRLGRNVREQLRAWDRVEAAGGKIIVVREGIDTSTPNGRMHRTILLAIAENEREQHVDRFAERRRLATKAGIWQRRQTPTGYSKDPKTRKLVPDDRAPAVQAAFRDRVAGKPLSHVARKVGMTTSGVRQMLANRVYLGELKVGPDVNLKAHPALIDEDTWLAAQAMRVVRPGKTTGEPAMLAGLVRCCGCSHVMTRSRSGKKPVYACPTHHSLGKCTAPAAIMTHILDRHVEQIVLEHFAMKAAAAPDKDRLDSARAAHNKARRDFEVFLEALDAAGVGVEQAAKAIRAKQAEIDRTEAELSDTLAQQAAAPLGDLRELWPKLSDGERNHVLRGGLEAVLVMHANRRASVDRIRVIEHGAGLVTFKRGGRPLPIVPIVLPGSDDPAVLRVPGV